jgi:hypothetical protein
MTTLTHPLISKQCCTCKESLPVEQFHKNKSTKTGLANECKSCKRVRQQEYNKANPDKWRELHFAKAYGIDVDEYNQLLAKQNGCCAICGTTEPKDGRRFAVDHCHDTGKIRGILCRPCNSAIGYLNDDYQTILRAAAYLEASQPSHT